MAHSLILFDGVCAFCSASVAFLLHHAAGDPFRYVPSQSDAGQRLLREHGMGGGSPGSMVLIEDGILHLRSAALMRIARRLDWPWNLAQWTVVIPAAVRDAIYDLVAKNRYRLGRNQTCLMPTADLRAKFLG